MGFWEIFKNSFSAEKDQLSRLHDKIRLLFPAPDQETENSEEHEEQIVKIACLAGLLARVAYCDFHVDASEKEQMKLVLSKIAHINDELVETISELAISEIKDLAGLENHKYCYPLNKFMTNEQKYDLLIALFAIAASDGEVGHDETEEIRLITASLQLEHKYFISARAQYKDKLSLLRA